MLFYLVFRFGAFLVRVLPRRWGIAIACGVGALLACFSPAGKGYRDNYRHVLGPDGDPGRVREAARRAFQNRVLNYYEMVWLSGNSLGEIDWHTAIEGLEYVDRLAKQKRGAVIASGHLGPMELMIQGVASLGYDLIGIMEHLDNARLHQYIIQLRTAHGLHMISTQGSLLDVYRRIKRGEILLSTADRDSTNTGMIVDFFGAPAWLPDGYARLAVRANVPVLFGYSRRTKIDVGGKVFPPIYPDPSLPKEEAVRDVIERTVRFLEQAIQENPGEWHLSTPVWQLARARLEEATAA